jgi:hypothetical protein
LVPSRAGASGSHHLPWALPRVLQSIPKIKGLAGGSDWHVGRACGAVCSKDASNAFIPGKHASAIAASAARRAARKWSRWKAQQAYRATVVGKQKRNGQSRHYRERVRSRKPPEPEAVSEPARVITTEHFFRPLLRPAGLLREIRACAAKSLTTLLLPRLPARAGARRRTGAALETGADLIRRY